MAELVGMLCTSHVPAIGVAMDRGMTDEPYWKPLFDGYEPARQWIRDKAPDAVVLVFNDHATVFDLDVIPTFAIGTADHYKPADEGWGPRPVPDFHGHGELGWHIAESLILDEFDITVVNNMDLDHGFSVPMSITCGQPEAWPFKVVPLAVNVVQYPVPTGNRCFNLGRAIRRAIDAWDEDIRVAVFGTGGMSHQLHGERAGLTNPAWDKRFLDDLSSDTDRLRSIPHIEYVRETGAEGIETVMWLIARGALGDDVREVYRHYHVPASNTATGLIILEENAA